MPTVKDITGLRSGKLTAVRPHHSSPDKRRRFWLFRCDCGTEKIMRPDKVVSGLVRSCGCNRYRPGIWRKPPDTTGRRKWGPDTVKSRTYKSWASMLSRCTNPKSDAYEYYGATGITVCERWESFGNFLADMGERPLGKTLDRWPDRYGNYEPGNCRWATPKEQANNKRVWGSVAAKKFSRKLPAFLLRKVKF